MTVADIVKKYRVEHGPGTRMMSYRDMAAELSRYVPGRVSRGSIYLWMRGTTPRPTLIQTLLDHGQGWTVDFARELWTLTCEGAE